MNSYHYMENHISMSKMDESKVVQTELAIDDYRRLARIAEDEGKSLKQTLREAAEAYIESQEQLDRDSPLFTFHDRVTVPEGERTDASDLDRMLYASGEGTDADEDE